MNIKISCKSFYTGGEWLLPACKYNFKLVAVENAFHMHAANGKKHH